MKALQHLKRCRLIGLLCLTVACANKTEKEDANSLSSLLHEAAQNPRYAKGFSFQPCNGYTLLYIHDHWHNNGQMLQTYTLIPRNNPPNNLPPNALILQTPLHNVALLASVHAAFIEQLNQTEHIVAIADPQYITSPLCRQRLREGNIADLGTAAAPNTERMLNVNVQYLFASPISPLAYEQSNLAGATVVLTLDHLEPHPLARAEWLKLYGLLFDQRALADSLFRATEARYLALRALANNVTRRPSVLTEKRYGNVWYVPEGNSYIAQFIRDAGAQYIFNHLPGTASTPLAFETVFNYAVNADFWLIKYNDPIPLSYAGLRAEYPPYQHFNAFQQRNIYTCHTGQTPYYNETPLHPDLLLLDFIRIFHPLLLTQHPLPPSLIHDSIHNTPLRYYTPLPYP